MKIIGYHIDQGFLANSDPSILEVIPEADPLCTILDFLLEPKPDAIRVLWNLNYSVAVLLKMLKLGPVSCAKLWTTKKLHLTPENYELEYVPSKYLAVRQGKHKGAPFAFFNDANQYHKKEIDDAGTQRDTAYCLSKANEARTTATDVYNALCSVGLHPSSITSPVKVYEKEVLSEMLRDGVLPTIDDLPDGPDELAAECAHGGWVEAFHRGHWEESWDYDVRSSYAYNLSTIPDTRLGEWVHNPVRPSAAILGFLEGEITVQSNFSPIFLQKGDKELYTPVGKWHGFITLEELTFIYRHDLGQFLVKDAWWWIPSQAMRYPYRYIVNSLYEKTKKATGLQREVLKRTMAGLYGLSLQTFKDSLGDYYNPVIGSVTEVRAKLQVASFCFEAMKKGAEVLHVAVDGCILDKPMPEEWLSTDIGGWRLSSAGPAIIASSGLAAVRDDDANQTDFSLDYHKLRALLEKEAASSQYVMQKTGFFSLGRAFNEERWEEMGNIESLSRTINIDQEKKRRYSAAPHSGLDLLTKQYDSVPWDAHLLSSLALV